MKKKKEPQDMTIREVAEKLGITSSAVLGLINRGRFPNAHKLPGGKRMPYLIPDCDYDAYLVYREARNKKRRQPIRETTL